MKKIWCVGLLGVLLVSAEDAITIGAEGAQQVKNEPMKIYGGILAPSMSLVNQLMDCVKKDIERSGQFELDLVPCALPQHKKDITALFEQGYPLLLFIDELKKGTVSGVEWRLYDATAVEMVKGKKQELALGSIAQQAHELSNRIWKELLGGQQAPFVTRIAYIKRGKNRLGKRISQLCTSDWCGQDEHLLLSSQRILVAPTWYAQSGEEQLFFSEFTPSNVRCMKLDKRGNKLPLFDLDGTCVGISCSKNNEAVYCRSGSLWKYKYDEALKRGIHERIVHRDQPCTHPTVLENGDIIFCSGGAVYCWNHETPSVQALTKEGYCVAPDVYQNEGKIVYSQRIKGVMQLMVLDRAIGISEQLTFDGTDKIDPRWSPCGRFIVFCIEKGRNSRIGIIHRDTRAFYYLTPASEHCSYPAWSSFGSLW